MIFIAGILSAPTFFAPVAAQILNGNASNLLSLCYSLTAEIQLNSLAPAWFYVLKSSVQLERRGPLKKVTAIYPGSFDPPTNGHLDLVERGSKIFDELVVAVLRNAEKTPLFSIGERRRMLEDLTAKFKNVRVDVFDGLTVDYAARVKASAVLRGIRALSDYEYELQMALMNRKLRPELETVFMMPAEKYSYLSSRLVREVARLGGDVSRLVPELVEQRLKEKLDPVFKLSNRKVKAGRA
jgi:pantetheine-phosphate adenylyltransferase